MLCELFHPTLHGKDDTSDPNIDTHYLIYNIFDPYTGLTISYEPEEEEDFNDNFEFYTIKYVTKVLKTYYSRFHFPIDHPILRNYNNIIKRHDYIKPEIGEYIILPTLERIAILKTFWIRIIQRKWKKVFNERKLILNQRTSPPNLYFRSIKGIWPNHCSILPGLKGMLSTLT